MYVTLKFLHVHGVILLIGNVTATAFWKVMVDRAAEPNLIIHAQRNSIAADWLFTLVGIVLIIAGGYAMVLVSGMQPFGTNGLIWGQLLFSLSGVIWIGVLVPLQFRQNRIAKLRSPLAKPFLHSTVAMHTDVVDRGYYRHRPACRSDLCFDCSALISRDDNRSSNGIERS